MTTPPRSLRRLHTVDEAHIEGLGVATAERALLIAEDAHGVCGTVQLVL